MNQWLKLVFEVSENEKRELLQAWLFHGGAEAVQEFEDRIEAYIQDKQFDELKTVLDLRVPDISYTFEKVDDRNWNADWESNFDPVEVGGYHIRAEFHPIRTEKDVIISPRMAFGTGHHETTFMMIEYMVSMDFTHQDVLDYGCGTGLLAVFASLLGAKAISAIDIQPEAIENCLEHFNLNHLDTSNLECLQGDLHVLPGNQKFDIILANINRSVLQVNAEQLYDRSADKASLLISGILKADESGIIDTYQKLGFKLNHRNQKGEWCLLVFKK